MSVKTFVQAHGGGPHTPLDLISLRRLFRLSPLPSLVLCSTGTSSGAGSGCGGVCSTPTSSPLLGQSTSHVNLPRLSSDSQVVFSPLWPCIIRCLARLSSPQQCLSLSLSLVSFDVSSYGAGSGCGAICSTSVLPPTLQCSMS